MSKGCAHAGLSAAEGACGCPPPRAGIPRWRGGGFEGEEGDRMRRWICTGVFVVLALVGCTRPNTPEGVAERFVEAYYVQIDQTRALEFTAALARDKLQRELQLVAQARRGGSVEQARPKIEYTRTQSRPDGRQVFFIYALTIKPTHVAPMLTQVMISTEQIGEHWRVINFTELDVPR